MPVLSRKVSLVVATAVLAAVLGGAKWSDSLSSAPPGPAASRGAHAPEPDAPVFAYGTGGLSQTINSLRAGVCYPLDGEEAADTFHNGSTLPARLYPSPGCSGSPDRPLAPGEDAHGTQPRRGVVFLIPGGAGH